jgi:hypothetical protein
MSDFSDIFFRHAGCLWEKPLTLEIKSGIANQKPFKALESSIL